MAGIQTQDGVPPAEIGAEISSQRLVTQDLQVERPNSLSIMGRVMEPTTPHMERPSHDVSSNSDHPTQGSRRTSVSTIRADPLQHPSLPAQDLSRWHAQCRPFLLETIQRQTEQNVKAIALNNRELRQYLKQQLEQSNRRDDEHLTTLNLLQGTAIGDQFIADRAATRLTANSDSSVNSMSSQMSDSFLNDVQQSAALLKLSLNAAIAHSSSLRRSSFASFLTGARVMRRLTKPVQEVKLLLSEFGPQMASIGFSDVGLKLNQYNEDFKDDVLKFLDLEKKYSKVELRKHFDQTSEWKPWKDHVRLKTWKPKDEYDFLIQRINELGIGVGDTIQSAIETRDSFISRATEELNSIVLDFAQDAGFEVRDKWEGNMLVERIFKQEHFLLSQDVAISGT